MITELYKDGTRCECDRMSRVYYTPGTLWQEVPFVNNTTHGVVREYAVNGALIKSRVYKHGILVSAFYCDAREMVEIWYKYKDDQCHGKSKRFVNGKLANETMYVRGQASHVRKHTTKLTPFDAYFSRCPVENLA
jgi:antitoxin component YwqK of YwqJK toxin-antitoxin module